MKKKVVKLGWIGSGFVGQVAHLFSFNNIPDVKIVALSELRPKLGHLVCKKYSIPNYYSDHKELLKRNDLDGVVAIVRRYHTAPLAKEILKKGFNLFTEKPMAATFVQAKTLVQISNKQKLKYIIGNMRRHDEGVLIAKKYFEKYKKSKELGEIISFRTFCFAGGDYCNIDGDIKTDEPAPSNRIWPIAPKWVSKKNKKYFEKFLAYFVHDINLINFFFDKDPYKINTIMNKNGGNIQFNYGNFTGTFEYAFLDQNRWDEGMEIYFTKGRIKITLAPAFLRNYPAKVEIYKEKGGMLNISPKSNWSWSFQNQAKNFVDTIRENKKNNSTGSSSLRDMSLTEKIFKTIKN